MPAAAWPWPASSSPACCCCCWRACGGLCASAAAAPAAEVPAPSLLRPADAREGAGVRCPAGGTCWQYVECSTRHPPTPRELTASCSGLRLRLGLLHLGKHELLLLLTHAQRPHSFHLGRLPSPLPRPWPSSFGDGRGGARGGGSAGAGLGHRLLQPLLVRLLRRYGGEVKYERIHAWILACAGADGACCPM